MKTMVIVNKTLEEKTENTPKIGKREVLVSVQAQGYNNADRLFVSGLYPAPALTPRKNYAVAPEGHDPHDYDYSFPPTNVPGLEVSGIIQELGSEAIKDEFSQGDKVVALLSSGGYQTEVAVPIECLVAAPENITAVAFDPVSQKFEPQAGISVDILSGGIIESLTTVYFNLSYLGQLQKDQTLLIHGGTGSIGSMAIQYAKALGAQVITTVGSQQKTSEAKLLGADTVIDYREDDVAQNVMNVTDNQGVDLILDILGAGSLEQNIDVLAVGGKLVIIGLQQGVQGTIDLGKVMTKHIVITGSTLRPQPLDTKKYLLSNVADEIFPFMYSGKIKLVLDTIMPLEKSGEYIQGLNDATPSPRGSGKVIFTS